MVVSLQETLLGLVSRRRIVTITLDSGHQLELRLTSGGTNWVAGETGTAGGEAQGAVVPASSIMSLRGGLEHGDGQATVKKNLHPLQVMVASLVSLRKQVNVFGVSHRWSGVLLESHQDYLVLSTTLGEPVVVPHSALSWISLG